MDVLIAANNGPAYLYRNDQPGPNGRVEEFKNLKVGQYDCVEGKGIRASA
jgi:hypothetical protein